MPFSSPRSFHITAVSHHDRGLTLVFGSDGQVSLVGYDGISSQSFGVPPALTGSSAGDPAQGTRSLSDEPTSVVPYLEATTTSFASMSTSAPSSAPSSYNASSTLTDTDTNLPSIPTVSYPTPSPTAVSDPKDHGVGAPFYLAIVLASISFIGCVAAFIAWWIRSRTQKDAFELDDPWHERHSISNVGTPLTDNQNDVEKGAQTRAETRTRADYLAASNQRGSSSNRIAVPHTISTPKEGTPKNGATRILDAGRLLSMHRANEPHSSEATQFRPGTERQQTGSSVQESTRTLGRLCVTNRVPGDVTSGDEGGVNVSRIQDTPGVSPAANCGGPNAYLGEEKSVQKSPANHGNRSVQEGDTFLEPPGPATSSWGRRIDTVAALRRTRRRGPETTVQTYKNPGYSGYWCPLLDGRPNRSMEQAPVSGDQTGNEKDNETPLPDSLDWTSSLKSSFWQAVGAMTGNRSLDAGSRSVNAGSGSRLTPVPQRVTSRRPLLSSTGSSHGPALTDTPTDRFEETETKSESRLPGGSVVAQETTYGLSFRSSLTRTSECGAPRVSTNTPSQVDSPLPRVSHLNHGLGTNASPHRQPNSVRTGGSMYSTDSAAARANLRKYGYVDSIPSSWSALGANRESQLDPARTFLPFPGAISGTGPGPFSITVSQPTLESTLQSGSASVRTPTTMYSENDIIGSDANTLRSGRSMTTTSHGEPTTSSMYGMSRQGTIQSLETSPVGPETASLQTSSTTSNMLSRRKGVTTRRKQPKPLKRAPSTASSVQSIDSGLSIREMAVRRALLERRKKVKAAENVKNHKDIPMRGHDDSSTVELPPMTP